MPVCSTNSLFSVLFTRRGFQSRGRTQSCTFRWVRLLTVVELPAAHGSQQDYMLKDQCILVDEEDTVTGHASKRDCHAFTEEHPTGLLHRAFSVFLFNSEVKMACAFLIANSSHLAYKCFKRCMRSVLACNAQTVA